MSLFSQRRKQKLTYKDIKKHYEDIIEGFHSGFPECCILQYVLDISNGLSPSTERQNSFQNLIFPDWVPCDKHCQHFINITMAKVGRLFTMLMMWWHRFTLCIFWQAREQSGRRMGRSGHELVH